MRSITTEELAVLIGELKEFDGFYIDRFYELGEGRFRLRLSKSKVQSNLQIILSHTINKTGYMEKSDEATGFSLAVRKRIEGFHIEAIEQIDNDRIALFRLVKGEAKVNMIIEMFGKGNLILADQDMSISLAYTVHDFKDRSIRPGIVYRPPKQTEGYRARRIEDLAPTIYRDKTGKAIDYAAEQSARYKDYGAQRFKTLQETLDAFYHENPVTAPVKKARGPVEELESSIEKQEKLIKQVEGEVDTDKELGKMIFDNMNEINSMIKAAQSNKRITKEELQRIAARIKVLNVDLKDKTFTIEL